MSRPVPPLVLIGQPGAAWARNCLRPGGPPAIKRPLGRDNSSLRAQQNSSFGAGESAAVMALPEQGDALRGVFHAGLGGDRQSTAPAAESKENFDKITERRERGV